MRMGEIRSDPSMDDILASIKRIIAEDGATVPPPASPARARKPIEDVPVTEVAEEAPEPQAEEVLELTQPFAGAEPAAAAPQQEPLILSMDAATASQHALSALSAMLVKTKPGQDHTLEGLVREMLRPMLKDWLDAKLPAIVEELVQREIARITRA